MPKRDDKIPERANDDVRNSLNPAVSSCSTPGPSRVTLAVTTPSRVTPAVTTPSRVTPAVITPSRVTPAVTTPSRVTPAVTTPSRVTPAVTTPSRVTPAVTTPSGVTPAVTTPSGVTPAVTTPSRVTPAVTTPLRSQHLPAGNTRMSSATSKPSNQSKQATSSVPVTSDRRADQDWSSLGARPKDNNTSENGSFTSSSSSLSSFKSSQPASSRSNNAQRYHNITRPDGNKRGGIQPEDKLLKPQIWPGESACGEVDGWSTVACGGDGGWSTVAGRRRTNSVSSNISLTSVSSSVNNQNNTNKNNQNKKNKITKSRQQSNSLQKSVSTSILAAPRQDTASRNVKTSYQQNPKTSYQQNLPLEPHCDHAIRCRQCFRPGMKNLITVEHECEQNILLVHRNDTGEWIQVRERVNHTLFRGRYQMCKYVEAGRKCYLGVECKFAHSPPEQFLWSLEKEKKSNFSITQFIISNRTNTESLYSLQSILTRYQGRFLVTCSECYDQNHQIVDERSITRGQCKRGHQWVTCRILVYIDKINHLYVIHDRPEHDTTLEQICAQVEFCSKKSCGKAHSSVERDLWCMQRDFNITSIQLLEMVRTRFSASSRRSTTSIPIKGNPALSTAPSRPSIGSTPSPSTPGCPYRVEQRCGLCKGSGQMSGRSLTRPDRCESGKHDWSRDSVFIMIPCKKILHPLPPHPRLEVCWLSMNSKSDFCRYMKESGFCNFAHSEEEKRMWQWMINNGVRYPGDLIERPVRQRTESSSSTGATLGDYLPAWRTGEGKAWGDLEPPDTSRVAAVEDLELTVESQYLCNVCHVYCNSEKQFKEHCGSKSHKIIILDDGEHEWMHRPPPRVSRVEDLTMCTSHSSGGRCRYSHVHDSNNLCCQAHSEGELDEWRDRLKWRQRKRQRVIQQNLLSYTDQLIQEYNKATAPSTVLCPDLDYVKISCDHPLNCHNENKMAEHIWTFEIVVAGTEELVRVALLQEHDSLHFFLNNSKQITQDCRGRKFLVKSTTDDKMYRVVVNFEGGLFGSFSQTVAFDFGRRPVLYRKISMDLGHIDTLQKLADARAEITFERWTDNNRHIVRAAQKPLSDVNKKILTDYKQNDVMEGATVQDSSLNVNNYTHRMHSLLNIEEKARAKIIASHNLQSEMRVSNAIQGGTFVFSAPGELFGEVQLSNQLNDDTDAGNLILRSVSSVLLALQNSTEKIYEVDIVQRDDFSGKSRDFIYLSLSQSVCEGLGLKKDSSVKVEIQFQMDRLLFSQMHYAVDRMKSHMDILFPNPVKSKPKYDTKNYHQHSRFTKDLNKKQKNILTFCSSRPLNRPPLLVVHGPFGTGKTETIFQSSALLAGQNSDVRILICTHTNQAADEYIRRFSSNKEIQSMFPDLKVLRIYDPERRVFTVTQEVRGYCLFDSTRSSFRAPTLTDLRSVQIVVATLVNSLMMTSLGVGEMFSHIFIDEAAQVEECQAIMPLSLGGSRTCVVVAGDHMQMGQRVYSEAARRQKFQLSVVERIMTHYKQLEQESRFVMNLFLTENYRNDPAINSFVSSVYYSGSEVVKSKKEEQQFSDGSLSVLSFYAAEGEEVQENQSTSFYNQPEVDEVVERVHELSQAWPVQWGDKNLSSILVTTPYSDQVTRLRAGLRKRSRELGQVTVIRVHNVPGLEFRAVFISTVRTRHLISHRSEAGGGGELSSDLEGDLGFLSDPKLLNSAITRAQSFIGVIGDPVALCSIGQCKDIWKKYLHNAKLYPQSLTVEGVKLQCEQLCDTFHINDTPRSIHQQSQLLSVAEPRRGNNDNNRQHQNAGTAAVMSESPGGEVERRLDLDDWCVDYRHEPDQIINWLAEDSYRESARSSTPAGSQALPVWPSIRPNAYLYEQDDHAFFRSEQDEVTENLHERYRDTENGLPTATGSKYSIDELLNLLKEEPKKYKRCLLDLERPRERYARPLDQPSEYRVIKLMSRLRCGHGFHSDEVVVEVLTDTKTDSGGDGRADEARKEPYGQVIGILKHGMDPRYRLFVCQLDERSCGLMVPLNPGIPKILNLESKNNPTKKKQNVVFVYTYSERNQKLQFDRFEEINSGDRRTKLFVVRYLSWREGFTFPLGIVVDVIEAGYTLENSMKILKIEHNILSKFKHGTTRELNSMYGTDYKLPRTAMKDRHDFRKVLTFTIDPPHSTDLDDAISYEVREDRMIVSVHIADVSYFVKKGSELDAEARARGTSYYSQVSEHVPMLPHRLSSDLCSLLPGQDKLTVSVILTVDGDFNIKECHIRRTIIKSQFRLNYDEVEKILDGTESSDDQYPADLIDCLKVLYNMTFKWRQDRLGAAAAYYNQLDISSMHSPQAHNLVETLMIEANKRVAEWIKKRFPDCTPMRHQSDPNAVELNEWKESFVKDVRNSVALIKPYKEKREVCACSGDCLCITHPQNNDNDMTLSTSAWEKIINSLLGEDVKSTQTFLLSPEYQPRLSLILLRLRFLQCRGEYVSSGDIKESGHHSMNLDCYTHFTSPIRRYVDLMVHRLVVAAVEKTECPYSKADMTELCLQCTDASDRARKYEQATLQADLCRLLQQTPFTLHPIVYEITDRGMSLKFPTVPFLSRARASIEYCNLNVNSSRKPEVHKGQLLGSSDVSIEWSQRIYSTTKPAEDERNKSNRSKTELKPDKYTVSIRSEKWKNLMNAFVGRTSTDDLTNIVNEITKLVNNKISTKDDLLTSEGSTITSGKHFCEYSLKLTESNLIKIQMSTELHRGLLIPTVQLLYLTDRDEICVEHHKNTMACFADLSAKKAALAWYADIEEYKSLWLPVLTMAAVRNSIKDSFSAIIHNVTITWRRVHTYQGEVCIGTFSLTQSFCIERYIKIAAIKGSTEDKFYEEYLSKLLDNDGEGERSIGFACVRYRNLTVEPLTGGSSLRVEDTVDLNEGVTWVGHCWAVRATEDEETGHITVHLKLHQSTTPIPPSLLDTPRTECATVEWSEKTTSDIRMEKAILKLNTSTSLARGIALGTGSPKFDHTYSQYLMSKSEVSHALLKKPNTVQQGAIQSVLEKSFAMIQGPPGTGKTAVVVRLACMFAQVNQVLPSGYVRRAEGETIARPQVFCCGPSNKAVDVIAGSLKRLNIAGLVIVRVYSEKKEQLEFPIPRTPQLIKKRFKLASTVQDQDLQSISLHHMIRDVNKNPNNAKKIREYDRKFREEIDKVTDEDIKEYKNEVSIAVSLILGTADILLLTCSASGARRIMTSTNAMQLILDECGMCTEPESLVPVSLCQPKHVVLVGDDKQLRPIITEPEAERRGLDRSLFERYSQQSFMLTTQYRMHKAIQEFPSQQFYDGKLETGHTSQDKPSKFSFWPGGSKHPIAFIQLEGVETSQAVATEEGGLQSKSNRTEVDTLVRIVKALVDVHRIEQRDIAVLSQYRAQCAELTKLLQSNKLSDVTVQTVVSAQGSEWPYVLLSTVRSLPRHEIDPRPSLSWKRKNLGFICDEHQINVALTRAKLGLIIVGNKYLLRKDEMWRKLIDHYYEKKALTSAQTFITALSAH